MNDSKLFAGINVRSPRYLIARTRGVCRHCKAQTNLFGLALPPGHATPDGDEDAEDAEHSGAADNWLVSTHHALLFHVDFLNAEVQARLGSLTRSFRLGRRDVDAAPAWANHCEACGAWLDDEELFCEPGEAFFPTSESSAASIRLLGVDEVLEAAAGGYSFDPNFFHAMSRE